MSPKTRCNGQWTQSRFESFIKSALRRASSRWSPKYECKKKAKVAYNTYNCAACCRQFGNKEIKIDHINPVVDPHKGFETWDRYIERLFVEVEGYQVLCIECHDKKTEGERILRKSYK